MKLKKCSSLFRSRSSILTKLLDLSLYTTIESRTLSSKFYQKQRSNRIIFPTRTPTSYHHLESAPYVPLHISKIKIANLGNLWRLSRKRWLPMREGISRDQSFLDLTWFRVNRNNHHDFFWPQVSQNRCILVDRNCVQ